MTYDEAIRFWFNRVNYEQRTPQPSDLKLDRMRTLLDLLGRPHVGLRVVHVAGSKGKGSTSAMLAAVLRRAGYRTGLFTSPHLTTTEERIQVDGQPITHAELAALMTDIRRAVDWMDAHRAPLAVGVTFFEIATALGLLHFTRRRCDVAVLEVGLGGRFDSTNVCHPLVAIITSISFDHTQQLGNTLASIAGEKAGIVKPRRPTVSGARPSEARAVIEAVCRGCRAPLRQLDAEIRYEHTAGRVTAVGVLRPHVRVTTDRRVWPELTVGLLGEHQAANAALAVAAVEHLRDAGLHLPDAAVADGLATVDWPARLEVVGRRPLVVLDCAHNVASAEALVEALRQSFPPVGSESGNGAGHGRRLLIFAASGDKDLAGMIRVLVPHFARGFLTRSTTNRRGVAPEQLLELWQRNATQPAAAFATPAEAWQAARQEAGADDLICVTGSVFVAGELRPQLVG
jgi:dihydrofolate synthase/folylpolyglutamate synthase